MKQVIVMRNDLNMRKGKMIAQGAHASVLSMMPFMDCDVLIPTRIVEWWHEGMTKICVRADSEAELLDIETKAREAGLAVAVVTDAGRTEFSGVPTKTCLAIGPDNDEDVDNVTGQLKLL